MRAFEIVAAIDAEGGIGKGGALPWRLRGDLAHFRALTLGEGRNAVVMGRRTWESLPERMRPLPGRRNAVVTCDAGFPLPEGVLRAPSLEAALELVASADRIFVIGGGEIFRQALRHPGCGRVHLTRIEGRFGCDTFFPDLGEAFVLESRGGTRQEQGVAYAFEVWRRIGEPGEARGS